MIPQIRAEWIEWDYAGSTKSREAPNLSGQCIHGFPIEQCISCRTCQHGQVTTTCAKCRAPTTTRKVALDSVPVPPSEIHGDYEVYFEPAVSGWRYRADESSPSQLSYRSAFLARKAIDQIGNEPEPKPTTKGKKVKAAK